MSDNLQLEVAFGVQAMQHQSYALSKWILIKLLGYNLVFSTFSTLHFTQKATHPPFTGGGCRQYTWVCSQEHS